MELVKQLSFFLISAAFIVLAWLGFLFLVNAVEKIRNAIIREVAGSLAAVALFVVIGLIIYQTAMDFFVGLVLTFTIWFVFFMVKKAWKESVAKFN